MSNLTSWQYKRYFRTWEKFYSPLPVKQLSKPNGYYLLVKLDMTYRGKQSRFSRFNPAKFKRYNSNFVYPKEGKQRHFVGISMKIKNNYKNKLREAIRERTISIPAYRPYHMRTSWPN